VGRIGRRQFIAVTSAAGFAVAGCSTYNCPTAATSAPEPSQFAWLAGEKLLLDAPGESFAIVVRDGPNSRVLRARARPVPAGLDLSTVELRMTGAMDLAGGVGIAGPQVGLSLRVAVLKLDYKTENPRLLFVRNPVIVERSDDMIDGYEGCLSIPEVGGLVRRNRWIRIEHEAIDGSVRTTEAEGYNAVLWQHELDHLDGVLYVDKLLGDLKPMDEVRRLREEKERQETAITTEPPGDQSRVNGDHLEGSTFLISESV
jgi:peptide deformylase